MTTQNHTDNLEKILGQSGVLRADDDLGRYEIGARGDAGKAAFVLRPTTTKETALAVAYCVQNNIHIIPQSGNTGLVGGSIPDDSGAQAILSLERINTVFEIDPTNKSAHIGAGIRLSALNQACEAHGLFFPVDLSADPCLGGMIATNTGGGRFLKYGGVRENVLGLKVVLADAQGTVLDLLCPLYKNNTGIDLKHVFIGTSGALGIVTEAIIKLTPIPQQSATALLIPSDIGMISPLLRALEMRCGDHLSAFEYMSGESMSHALAHAPSLQNPFSGGEDIPPYALLIELSRTWNARAQERSLDDMMQDILAEIWELPDAPLADAIIAPPQKLWALRHAISEGVQKSGKLYAFDISFKRGDVTQFLVHMQHALPARFSNISICDFGHIGDGGVHFNLVVARDDARAQDPAFEKSLRDFVYDVVVTQFKGSFSAEHALGRKNQPYYDLYTPETIKKIAAGLQETLNPAGMGSVKL